MIIYQFTCPECGKHELGSVEEVILTYPVTKILEEGNLDIDTDSPIAGDRQVLAYRCLHCGYELKDEQENTIADGNDVVKWVKNHGGVTGTGPIEIHPV